MDCERRAIGNPVLVKEVSLMSFIVSQLPTFSLNHKIKIEKGWQHRSPLYTSAMPLLVRASGMCCGPAGGWPPGGDGSQLSLLVLNQGAPLCRVCPTIARSFFHFLSGLFLLGFHCCSLHPSDFIGRMLGFPLQQLPILSSWVSLLVGLFPLPDISFFPQ